MIKKRVLSFVLALMLVGSAGVFAYNYTFNFDRDNSGVMQYSGDGYKGEKGGSASVTQTPSTPGTYKIEYTVVTSSALTPVTSSIQVFGNDYSQKSLPYTNTNAYGNMKLRGRYVTGDVITMNGTWAP